MALLVVLKPGVMREDEASRLRIVRVLDQLLEDRETVVVPIPQVVGDEIDVVGCVSFHFPFPVVW